ncbi:MAG: 2-phosphosulfolactate phosphatase [Deltaproteobacteria bacterium]|nr:2-phosphosulfolactate phosphatase [Deltaproteobacteria bacterium]
MKTTIKHGLNGAEAAGGTVVIIDVFRASNTILMLLARGASCVIPVMKVKEAFELKKLHPEYLLAGERKGITIDGFDMGNSPHDASQMNLAGKDVILTTSGGTRATRHARNAERILIGSFGNARALVDMLRQSDTPSVTWLAVGTEGVSRAIEDDLCAKYLKGIAEGKPQNPDGMIKKILDGEGAARLRRLGQEDDFSYCLATDLFDFVPELSKTDSLNGFVNREKL